MSHLAVEFVRYWNRTRDVSRPQWCSPAKNLNMLGWSLKMATNAVATAMIAYTAWWVHFLFPNTGHYALSTLGKGCQVGFIGNIVVKSGGE